MLDGTIPWVTGGAHADYITIGATCEDGRQILAVLPTDLPGVAPLPPADLVGLSSTHTGEVRCQNVRLGAKWLLAGPVENVLSQAKGAGTGGAQTSALAIGLSSAALEFFEAEAEKRAELAPAAVSLREEHRLLENDLLTLVAGSAVCSAEDLRQSEQLCPPLGTSRLDRRQGKRLRERAPGRTLVPRGAYSSSFGAALSRWRPPPYANWPD